MGFSFLKYHNSKRSQIKRGVWKRGIAIALFATPRLSPPNCWGIWVSLGQLPVQAWGLHGSGALASAGALQVIQGSRPVLLARLGHKHHV